MTFSAEVDERGSARHSFDVSTEITFTPASVRKLILTVPKLNSRVEAIKLVDHCLCVIANLLTTYRNNKIIVIKTTAECISNLMQMLCCFSTVVKQSINS